MDVELFIRFLDMCPDVEFILIFESFSFVYCCVLSIC